MSAQAVFIGEQLSLGRAPCGFSLGARPIDVATDGSVAVAVGSSVRLASPDGSAWMTPGVVTSDATVLEPTDTTNTFFAIAPGAAVLTGTTSAGSSARAEVTVKAPEAHEEKKGLSTGAMVGIWTAILATGGTVFYLATRKPKRRRRKAA